MAAIVLVAAACKAADGPPAVATVAVSPSSATLQVGLTTQLSAIPKDASGTALTNAVVWSSGGANIAAVSASGLVSGVAVGTVSITATSGGKQGSVSVTVIPPAVATVTVTLAAPSIEVGLTTQATAVLKDVNGNVLTGRSITWSNGTSSPQVATVSTSGLVTGQSEGVMSISATSEGVSGAATVSVIRATVATVTVTLASSAIPQGATTQATALLTGAGGTTLTGRTIVWSSSSSGVASVSSTGLVTALGVGTSNITATSEGRSGSATLTVTIVMAGRVLDALTSAPIAGASVQLTLIASGSSTTVTTGSDGTWTSSALAEGAYRINASATGYVTTTIATVSLVSPRTDVEPIPLMPAGRTSGGISGFIRNATNNSVIFGATVTLRAGMNATTGTVVATTTTNTSGAYSFTGIGAGIYTVVSSATGFSDASRTGILTGNGTTTTGQDLAMSPIGSALGMRIILTWGSTPSDLDAHLTGPTTGSNRFHVYYPTSARGSCTFSPNACLDVDDVSSFGPETITISSFGTGVYRYYVHDYTTFSSSTSTALGSSGARVDVYFNNALLRTFFVPAGAGTVWTVFEYSGSTLTTINTISNISSTSLPIRAEGDAGTDWRLDEAGMFRRLPIKP